MSRSIDIYLNDGEDSELLASVSVPDPLPPGEAPPDPRTYYRPWTHLGSTSETPIAPLGAAGEESGYVSSYAQAIATTPGLTNWWRFGKEIYDIPGRDGQEPCFANSSGAVTLRSMGNGTPFLTDGLIDGDSDPGCDLNGGYLDAFDYRVFPSTNEVWTAELWVDLRSLKNDTALMGEWLGGSGWLMSASGSGVHLFAGNTHMDAFNALTTGRHHVVGVFGGFQPPTPDYYSRIYVDGVSVKDELMVGSPNIHNDNARFQIGQYANGAGSNSVDGIVDEVAVYNRMLQPEEVAQHYELGVGS